MLIQIAVEVGCNVRHWLNTILEGTPQKERNWPPVDFRCANKPALACSARQRCPALSGVKATHLRVCTIDISTSMQ